MFLLIQFESSRKVGGVPLARPAGRLFSLSSDAATVLRLLLPFLSFLPLRILLPSFLHSSSSTPSPPSCPGPLLPHSLHHFILLYDLGLIFYLVFLHLFLTPLLLHFLLLFTSPSFPPFLFLLLTRALPPFSSLSSPSPFYSLLSLLSDGGLPADRRRPLVSASAPSVRETCSLWPARSPEDEDQPGVHRLGPRLRSRSPSPCAQAHTHGMTSC